MINRILSSGFKTAFRLFQKYQKQSQFQLFNKYIEFDSSSNIDHLTLDVRKNSDKKFMKIGNNSVIGGSYVFEKESGVITIGQRTFIGMSSFHCIDGIDIGDDVLISWGCTVTDHNSHSIDSEERSTDVADWKKGIDENKMGFYKNWDVVKHAKITIKNKVWIGFNCIITKGVTIGEGAILGSGSVIRKDVAPYTLVIGNPAQVVREVK